MTLAAKALRPTILICDDEPPLRELVQAALGDRYDFVEAENVDDAESVLSETTPALIVLDVMLPGRSGLDFLTELRSGVAARDVPVVVVSAWQAPEQQRAALAAGASAFLGKPFDPAHLASIVEELVDA